jgi:signal transduction histidine kinase
MQGDAKLVLVVDNNPDVISFLVDRALPESGYRSVTVATLGEAWHIVNQQHPDVVLLGAELPDANALDLVEQFRRNGVKTPIVLMTSHDSEKIIVRLSRLGMRNYLMKPLTTAQVSAVIEDALYVARLEEEKGGLARNLRQRIRELTVLERIGQSVAATLDLDTLFNRVVEASVFITRAEEGFLLLLDQETNELYLRAAKNLGEEQVRLLRHRVTDNLLGQVVRTGRPLRLGGTGSVDSKVKVVTGYLVRAVLHVPLIVQNQVVGVLSVHNRATGRTFSENDQEHLSALADYAAIAVQNARLHAELKEKAAQVEAAYAELKELSQLQTRFVQEVSHELGVPLTYISGYVDLLREGTFGEIKPEQREPLDIIARRVEQITRLVRDMLTLQRLESEGLELAQVDLVEIARAAITDARAAAQRASLILEEDFPKLMPPILADPERLSHVFDNLLSNAIKFSPQGGTVRVRICEKRHHVNVYISDTGVGIPPDELEHLFVRFYRVQRAGQAQGEPIPGTGLGLSIVKAIVDAHRGHVTVQSRAGQGSTFSFSLPKAGPEARPIPPPTQLDHLGQ